MEENIENVPAGENQPVEERPAEEKPAEPPAEIVEEKVEPLDETRGREEGKPEPAPEPVAGERKWYVLQTMTGQEERAKQAIEQTIEAENLSGRVFQVLVPLEETVEIKGGKRVEKVRKMFPGYVFVEMILDEETWYLIRQTAGVARFIGTKVRPTPVSDKEMQRVLKQLGKEEKLEVFFEKGESVRVISGPFRGYTGTVDEINAEKGKLKVLINIFGRDTPVEVNFEHAQKIV
jgi:transcriptional antiterminator NusG